MRSPTAARAICLSLSIGCALLLAGPALAMKLAPEKQITPTWGNRCLSAYAGTFSGSGDGATSELALVPEPSTVLLIGLGLAVLDAGPRRSSG